jgi:ribosome production factor 2
MSVDEDGILSRKAKTARGARFLKKRGPQVHENAKSAIFLRGVQSDENVNGLLLDLFNLKKPLGLHFTKRNQKTHPFEDAKDLEYLCKKNDTSLFAFGSKSKKRPFRLLLGRTFDANILDMQEFSVSNYKSSGAAEFKGKDLPRLGSKPLVIFQGSAFDHDADLRRCKNLLLDFFRGPSPAEVALQAVDHVISFTVLDPPPGVQQETKTILMRHHLVRLKKSGTKLPRVELEEVPKEAKTKKVKNVTTDKLGNTKGRIHIEKQDFSKLNTPHAHSKQFEKNATGAKPGKRQEPVDFVKPSKRQKTKD